MSRAVLDIPSCSLHAHLASVGGKTPLMHKHSSGEKMRCCLRNAIVLTYGIAVTGLSMRPLAAPTSRLPLTAPTSFLSQVPRSDISLGMNLGHARAQTTSLASLPKAPARAFCVQLWRHVARFAARTIVLAMLLFSVHALPALAKGGGGTGGGSGGGGGSSSSSSSYSRSYDRGSCLLYTSPSPRD